MLAAEARTLNCKEFLPPFQGIEFPQMDVFKMIHQHQILWNVQFRVILHPSNKAMVGILSAFLAFATFTQWTSLTNECCFIEVHHNGLRLRHRLLLFLADSKRLRNCALIQEGHMSPHWEAIASAIP